MMYEGWALLGSFPVSVWCQAVCYRGLDLHSMSTRVKFDKVFCDAVSRDASRWSANVFFEKRQNGTGNGAALPNGDRTWKCTSRVAKKFAEWYFRFNIRAKRVTEYFFISLFFIHTVRRELRSKFNFSLAD
jgi:hypothetical protein